MQKTFALLAMLAICNIFYAQNKSDWKDLRLKGKVKSLKTSETHRYMKNGVFTPWEKSYGRLTTFNNTGQQTEFNEFFANDSLYYRAVYKYSAKERQTEVSYFNKDLKPTTKKIYKYDEKGNKIEEFQFTPEGQRDRRYTYVYNANNSMIEMISYKADGTLYSRTTWQYDAKNNAVEYKIETPGYANSSNRFVYDDKSNIIEETWHDGKGAMTFRFARTYDAQGNKIKEVKYKDGTRLLDTIVWIYEYDKNNNWIKKIDRTSTGEDYHIEERMITYY